YLWNSQSSASWDSPASLASFYPGFKKAGGALRLSVADDSLVAVSGIVPAVLVVAVAVVSVVAGVVVIGIATVARVVPAVAIVAIAAVVSVIVSVVAAVVAVIHSYREREGLAGVAPHEHPVPLHAGGVHVRAAVRGAVEEGLRIQGGTHVDGAVCARI